MGVKYNSRTAAVPVALSDGVLLATRLTGVVINSVVTHGTDVRYVNQSPSGHSLMLFPLILKM